MPDLLLELFSEEIPARMQARAAADLRRLVTDRLVEAGLTYSGAGAFATPRRLALSVTGLPAQGPDRVEERRGPRADAPVQAVEGFLRSTGLARDQLEEREDRKGRVLFATIRHEGRPAPEAVAEAVEHAVRSFPWPKSMRWGGGSLRWVRPLQSILCILTDEQGAEAVPLEIDGIRAGATTRGHRFMAPEPVSVRDFDDYTNRLRAGRVILDAEDRAERIRHDMTQLAFARGLEPVEDPGLLAEVAGLVEWPVVLMGTIDAGFLDLPPEVLQTSMKAHQKFFSVRNPATGRIEQFVTVANIEAPDGGAAILAGNDRVLSARLADAKFFWENDLRTVRDRGLEGMAKPLEGVVFHARLGTQAERVRRIETLAREIAPAVGALPDLAAEAARVAKADLASEMVNEFPELQGVMGRYYAAAAGHDDGVPDACEEHYRPLGPLDSVPEAPLSVTVALADKIDMLTGFWAIDEKPTGSKDPFALRRAGLGVIRCILHSSCRVNLEPFFIDSIARFFQIFQMREVDKTDKSLQEISRFPEVTKEHKTRMESSVTPDDPDTGKAALGRRENIIRERASDLLSFLADRLKVVLRDEGMRHDVIDACFALGGQDDLVLLVARVWALQEFLATEDGANLLAGYRRASSIVEIEGKKDGVAYEGEPSPKFADQAEERALFAALDAAEPAIAAAVAAEDFTAAMREMATLRAPVDAFFDAVLVNSDNAIVRRNRLCLLNRVRVVMGRVAVWEKIEG